jgi:hypothetical protein
MVLTLFCHRKRPLILIFSYITIFILFFYDKIIIKFIFLYIYPTGKKFPKMTKFCHRALSGIKAVIINKLPLQKSRA